MKFAERMRSELEPSPLAAELTRMREESEDVWDLTQSNPTRAGFTYPSGEILSSLSDARSLTYEPSPRGLRRARDAVSRYYELHGRSVDPDDVILTSSTSEAFAVLLKLLCRAGDRVLVPRPSYPLLDWLAELEATEPVPYTIAYDGSGGFHIDAASLRASIEPQKRGSQPARAIFAVHPNNPTGSYVREPDRTQLLSMASESECPLIVDEVYLDYPLSSGQAPSSFAGTTNAPVFVVSGLSKLAGLPQMKLAWIVVGGEPRFRGAASKRLEHITDQYLSVGTPVQHALPSLLESTADLRRQIRSRIQENRESVARALESCTQATLWPTEGGWYAVIQLPAIRSADTWALLTLRECSVHVHPGTLFGFPYGSFVVVSLLTEVRVLREGLLRLAKFLNRIDVPAME